MSSPTALAPTSLNTKLWNLKEHCQAVVAKFIADVDTKCQVLITEESRKLDLQRQELRVQTETITGTHMPADQVVELDVGGWLYKASIRTLRKYEGSMLDAMFSGRHILHLDDRGRIFIDRDGSLFSHVLAYLRDGDALCEGADGFRCSTLRDRDLRQLKIEFGFFGLDLWVSSEKAFVFVCKCDQDMHWSRPPHTFTGAMHSFDDDLGKFVLCGRENSDMGRHGVKVCSVGAFVYAVGGFSPDTGRATRRLDAYNTISDQWEPRHQALQSLRDHAVCSTGGFVYVCGGLWENKPSKGNSNSLYKKTTLVTLITILFQVCGDTILPEISGQR